MQTMGCGHQVRAWKWRTRCGGCQRGLDTLELVRRDPFRPRQPSLDDGLGPASLSRPDSSDDTAA